MTLHHETGRGRGGGAVTFDAVLLRRLGQFCTERQAIWHRRAAGSRPPWTTDAILAQYHFTNVYRELDPGTVYANDVLDTLKTAQDRVWFAVAYRLINRRQTFLDYQGQFGAAHQDEWLAYLADRYQHNLTVKTNRHLTPSRDLYQQALDAAAAVTIPTQPTAAFYALRKMPGLGPFLSWQVHCDLVMARDIDYDPRFVSVGDGAGYAIAVIEGSRQFSGYWHRRHKPHKPGGRIRIRLNFAAGQEAILRLCDTQAVWLPAEWMAWDGRSLDAKNIEHSLCEWLRYERLRAGASPMSTVRRRSVDGQMISSPS